MDRRRVRKGLGAFSPADIESVTSLVFKELGLLQDEKESAVEPLGTGYVSVRDASGSFLIIDTREIYDYNGFAEAIKSKGLMKTAGYNKPFRLVDSHGVIVSTASELRKLFSEGGQIYRFPLEEADALKGAVKNEEEPACEGADKYNKLNAFRGGLRDEKKIANKEEVKSRILSEGAPNSLKGALCVLGLNEKPNQGELRKAYVKLSLAFHPDKFGDEGVEVFQKVSAAYEYLKKNYGYKL